VAHKHVDLAAAARAAFHLKLRRRRRAPSNRRVDVVERHHGTEAPRV
jgi:hypothetical protein